MNGAELALIAVLALLLIGPERLPHYAEQLARFVRTLKQFSTDTSQRVRDELGDGVDDFDLASLDPRQYDPRRIVRDALRDDAGGRAARAATPAAAAAATSRAAKVNRAPGGQAPFDDEST